MFLEVVFLTSLDVGPVDGNIFVSIVSAMDMEGSKGMDKLMNDGAGGITSIIKVEVLWTSVGHTNIRPASIRFCFYCNMVASVTSFDFLDFDTVGQSIIQLSESNSNFVLVR